MGYQARNGELPVDPEHAEDEAGQARLVQAEADTDIPAPDDTDVPPDVVTEDDGSGVAGGSAGSSAGGSSLPGHPDATR
ncbi:preprotein translocase YidC [Micromonospora sp. DT47]|uniref:preprotein translocase YidC n=1 Tax=Micromonospora sp. DT47 TaxID=3393431 RepID=UPI003CEC8CE3